MPSLCLPLHADGSPGIRVDLMPEDDTASVNPHNQHEDLLSAFKMTQMLLVVIEDRFAEREMLHCTHACYESDRQLLSGPSRTDMDYTYCVL